MSESEPTARRSPIFYEILAYLVDHPDAQDTVEGVIEWWLLEQRIERARTQVKTTLAQLVGEELVFARTGAGGRVSYRVNRTTLRDIRRSLTEEGKER